MMMMMMIEPGVVKGMGRFQYIKNKRTRNDLNVQLKSIFI